MVDAVCTAVVGAARTGRVLDAGSAREDRCSDVCCIGDTRQSFSEKMTQSWREADVGQQNPEKPFLLQNHEMLGTLCDQHDSRPERSVKQKLEMERMKTYLHIHTSATCVWIWKFVIMCGRVHIMKRSAAMTSTSTRHDEFWGGFVKHESRLSSTRLV